MAANPDGANMLADVRWHHGVGNVAHLFTANGVQIALNRPIYEFTLRWMAVSEKCTGPAGKDRSDRFSATLTSAGLFGAMPNNINR